MAMRSQRSFTRRNAHTPARPPSMAPAPRAIACGQCTSGEVTNSATAAAFMTEASTFLVAAAWRAVTPAIDSAAIIRKPIPPPK